MTANIHLALLDPRLHEDIRSQPITQTDTSAWRDETSDRIKALATQLPAIRDSVGEPVQDMIDAYLAVHRDLHARVDGYSLLDGFKKTRVHGDFHLGQILRASNGDIVAIDFEGEPAKSITERRVRYSPLKDLAGVLRSLSYARGFTEINAPGARRSSALAEWEQSERTALIAAYLEQLGDARNHILPSEPADIDRAIKVWELDKALYEAQYELANRPDWLAIPLRSMMKLV